MGDRCYTVFHTTARYAKALIEEYGLPDEYEDEEAQNESVSRQHTLIYYELNYGGFPACDKLACQGVQFNGWHEAGASYSPRRFVTHDNKCYAHVCDTEQQLTVTINDVTGEIDPTDLEKAREFLCIEQGFDERMFGRSWAT